MVEERDIGLVLTSDVSLSDKADKLIRLALDAGGTDNISLILIKKCRAGRPRHRSSEEERDDHVDGREKAGGKV